jgi:hypothetical protein
MDDQRLEAFHKARLASFLTVADLIAVLQTLPLDAPAFISVPGSSFSGPFALGSIAMYQWRNESFFGVCLSKMRS